MKPTEGKNPTQTMAVYRANKEVLEKVRKELTSRWGRQASFADVIAELVNWYLVTTVADDKK